ncbi:unnamed protein product [Discula destructiva]
MEDAATTLLGFPPAEPLDSNHEYDQAIMLHRTRVKELITKSQFVKDANAVQLLELLDPEVNSLSYLTVLDALRDYDGISAEQRSTATILFLTSFDVRQIRYVANLFRDYLSYMTSNNSIIPRHVQAGLISNSILRIDPTGSMLTTTHLELAELAFETDTADCAFSVLDKQIVYYPGMDKDSTSRRNLHEKILCDMNLSPPDYITPETGLTDALTIEQVLEYNFLCGLLYASRSQWKKARAAFERIITHPTRDGGVSKIMTEAYDKWLLLSLLVTGQTPEIPANAGSYAKKAYETLGKPYLALAAHFDAMTAVEFKKEVEAHAQLWHDDRNNGLIHEILAAHQKWQIMNLRKVYSKVSITQIRETTCSAETGNALPSDGDVEKLVQGMIDSKMLKGVMAKPDGKPAYLEYLPEVEELSEADYKKEVAAAMKRAKELEAVYRTTNARLGTNPYWLKHVIREQKREKDNIPHHSAMSYEAYDEDLMTGITPSGL